MLDYEEYLTKRLQDATARANKAEQTLERVRFVLNEWGLSLAGYRSADEDEDFHETIKDSGAWRLARDLRIALEAS